MRDGDIPVLTATGKTIAEAWENSILALHDGGAAAYTEYDERDAQGKPVYPPSLDATMVIVIADPAAEPAIHRAFPGGLDALEEYRLEVVAGIKDHWQRDPDDPEDKRWTYTYHERLVKYTAALKRERRITSGPDEGRVEVYHDLVPFDQLEAVARKVAAVPHTRRAQAITWKVWEDINDEHAPCLQSLWFRMLPYGSNADGPEGWRLNMNIRMRSWDAYDAAFMNLWAFAGPQGIQGKVAHRIAEISGKRVECGRVCAIGDSYHVYGKRRGHLEESFMKQHREKAWEDRTWTREFAAPIFAEAVPAIMEKAQNAVKR